MHDTVVELPDTMGRVDESLPGHVQVTSGEFENEKLAKAELLRRLARWSHLFEVNPEISGDYIQRRTHIERKDFTKSECRHDVLLIPKLPLVERGWNQGAISIEIKTSSKKLGTVVCQCLDYHRSVVTLKKSGLDIMPRWLFIWPLTGVKGDIASVMSQNRIGSLCSFETSGLIFDIGERYVIRTWDSGHFTVNPSSAGNKMGSR